MIRKVSEKYFATCYFHVRAAENSTFYYGRSYTKNNLSQNEILSHPDTRVFISHCEQNCVNEAIYAGVPIICIPLTGEQMYIASTVEQKGIGKYLDFSDENLIFALKEALNQIFYDNETKLTFNSEYTENAKNMRNAILEIYKKKPMKAKFLDKFLENFSGLVEDFVKQKM
uniref:glucuronosyltransferase n=1 Tax=Meloidogyne enterolobii TaxID=390850 RepID=A0A6V7XJV8_MELEN|nr:unnamed protein product [Meloidogyne enterolobii]